MLKEPSINVALAVNDARATLIVRRAGVGAGEMPSWVRWDLHEIEHQGHHALCQRIGNAALTMLIESHPDDFANFPLLVPPRLSALDELRGLVLDLIRRSLDEKTISYVAAIDNLFAQHAAELGQTDLPETWQSIRIRVMSRPTPS